jgi:hypothetical protein
MLEGRVRRLGRDELAGEDFTGEFKLPGLIGGEFPELGFGRLGLGLKQNCLLFPLAPRFLA